jgi:hypothetical protein
MIFNGAGLASQTVFDCGCETSPKIYALENVCLTRHMTIQETFRRGDHRTDYGIQQHLTLKMKSYVAKMYKAKATKDPHQKSCKSASQLQFLNH